MLKKVIHIVNDTEEQMILQCTYYFSVTSSELCASKDVIPKHEFYSLQGVFSLFSHLSQ